MKLLTTLLFYMLMITFISSCGGGSSDTATSNASTTPDQVVLNRLEGLWKGTLNTYLDDTDTIQCTWDVAMNLTSTKIPDSGFIGQIGYSIFSSTFKGVVSAELIYSSGEDSNKCATDSFDFDWSSNCISDEALEVLEDGEQIATHSCSVRLDKTGENLLSTQFYQLEYIIGSFLLSADNTRIFKLRDSRDDIFLNLHRS